MFWQRTLLASLLAAGAQAGISDLVMDGRTSNNPAGRGLAEAAMANLGARQELETRQAEGLGTDTPLNADGSLNIAAWNDAADRACQDSLKGLQLASNPSGTCVCYNLPLLDNSTGTFEADLRLYQVSEPTGQFAGIPQDQIEVELSYNGAQVTEVTQQAVARLKARQDAGVGGDLRMLQSYLFIGQIDQDRMTGQVTMAQLQALVMPTVTLKAINPSGLQVSTNVSGNEASFVTGVFSQEVVMSNFRMAELSVEADMAALRNGTIAFVLPGVQIMILPIGLIITSIWLALGLAAYGFGTYERYNFREAHKRRLALAQKANVARI